MAASGCGTGGAVPKVPMDGRGRNECGTEGEGAVEGVARGVFDLKERVERDEGGGEIRGGEADGESAFAALE